MGLFVVFIMDGLVDSCCSTSFALFRHHRAPKLNSLPIFFLSSSVKGSLRVAPKESYAKRPHARPAAIFADEIRRQPIQGRASFLFLGPQLRATVLQFQ